ncbi:polysaccharide deacetylase family protein [Ferrovum sp.]|uniref:polysaccharide deacetylase family protein n=1 Tax=Ferrovum sp. TaxID=2609467 RepID=UPI002617C371|nr:polysaccharide deacetylase family protein [Ferrovum sp.]
MDFSSTTYPLFRHLNSWLSPGGNAGSLSILIYHRVLPKPDPLFPDEVDALRFDAQLNLLKNVFHLLPLPEAVDRLKNHTLPPRAACLTFDDGYADNASIALPLLKKHGACATFFVASGYLNGGCMFNDRAIELVRHHPAESIDLRFLELGSLPLTTLAERQTALQALLQRLKYEAPEVRCDHLLHLETQLGFTPPSDLMMNDAQVLSLHQAGMSIGGHTVNHPILTSLPPAVARREIEQNRTYLTQLLGEPPALFAYPNGKFGQDYRQEHADMVREMGYSAALSTEPGIARRESDLFHLPRFTPWDRSLLRFSLRLSQNVWTHS